MCLRIDVTITDSVKKSLKRGKTRFWKIYSEENEYSDGKNPKKALFNIFRMASVPTKVSRRGVVNSDRSSVPLTNLEKRTGEIYHGIHVFTEEKDAKLYAKVRGYRAFPVYVNPKDFVFAGYGLGYPNAVFTKVRLDLNELKKRKLTNIQYYNKRKK